MQGTQLSTLPIIDPLKPQSITLQPFQLQNQDEQVPVQKKTLGQRIFAYTEFNPQWMVTSDTVSSKTLYKMRSMAALYMLIVLIYCFVKYWTDFEQFFKFWNTYTHLSFVALFFYFVVRNIP